MEFKVFFTLTRIMKQLLLLILFTVICFLLFSSCISAETKDETGAPTFEAIMAKVDKLKNEYAKLNKQYEAYLTNLVGSEGKDGEEIVEEEDNHDDYHNDP